MEATVAERGQITLPKAVRDALGLTKGTQLKVELDGGAHHPAQGRRRRACRAPRGALQAATGFRPPTRRMRAHPRPRPWRPAGHRRSTMIAIDSSVLIDLLIGDDAARRRRRGVQRCALA